MRAKKAAMRLTFNKIISSKTGAQLWWWYVVLLIPTLFFKYVYLDSIYRVGIKKRDGISVILAPLIQDPSSIWAYFYVFAFFVRDALEVLLLVVLTYVIGHLLLRLRVGLLMIATVFSCLLVSAANYVSMNQLGTLLTFDTFQISIHWLKDDPTIFTKVFTPKKMAFVPLAVLWGIVPLVASTKLPTSLGLSKRTRFLAGSLLVAFFAVSLLVSANLSATYSNSSSPFQGYWSNSFVTFFGLDGRNQLSSDTTDISRVADDYRHLIYPNSFEKDPQYLIHLPSGSLHPRHVIIVGLETAAQRYYPLVNNPGLPHFYQMSQQSIVSDKHYTTSPYTTWAVYSILTGTYFRSAASRLRRYGELTTDGLATVLKKNGYSTTYIDSYKIDWMGGDGNRRLIKNLGFDAIIETGLQSIGRDRDFYEAMFEREQQTFKHIFQSVLDAERHKKKALVFAMTAIGHYPWKSGRLDQSQSGKDKLYAIARRFDGLFGELLRALESRNLANDVIIVVTGDHGLRYKAEFESLGHTMQYGQLTFNVPFMFYAPGLMSHQVFVPYITSHVDIAPTLLFLNGVDANGLLYHGENLLDMRIQTRMTFMMNTGLSPVDGFYFNGYLYALNNLTGEVQIQRMSSASASDVESDTARPTNIATISDVEVKTALDNAKRLFDMTVAYFIRRTHGNRATP